MQKLSEAILKTSSVSLPLKKVPKIKEPEELNLERKASEYPQPKTD